MASRQYPPLVAAFYILALVSVAVFYLCSFTDFSIWLVAGYLPLMLLVAVITSMCRPSFRAQVPMVYHLWKASRALARSDYTEAEQRSRQAVACADAGQVNRDLSMGMSLAQLAEVYRQQGRLADAEPIYRQAVKHYDEATPYKPLPRATTVLNLGAVYINQGRYAEAESLCREALTVYINANSDSRIVALLNLGQALLGQKQYAEAAEVTLRALDMLAPQMDRGSLTGAIALNNLADVYCHQHRLTEAEPLARRGRAAFEKIAATAPPLMEVRFLNVLADIRQAQGNIAEAEALCQKAEAQTEAVFGPEHFTLARPLGTLARVRAIQGRDAEAEALYRRCLDILERATPEHPERAERVEEYVALLRKMGRDADAASWTTRAKANGIRADLPPGSYRA